MKVYVITREHDYEPSSLLAVTKTLEQAKRVVHAHVVADARVYGKDPESADYHWVEFSEGFETRGDDLLGSNLQCYRITPMETT